MQFPMLYVCSTETHLKFSGIGTMTIFQVREGHGLIVFHAASYINTQKRQ